MSRQTIDETDEIVGDLLVGFGGQQSAQGLDRKGTESVGILCAKNEACRANIDFLLYAVTAELRRRVVEQ